MTGINVKNKNKNLLIKSIDINNILNIYLTPAGGHSSVGRVQASQAWGRGFEARCPLHPLVNNSDFSLAIILNLW